MVKELKCRFKDNWKEYTEEEYEIIKKEREENKKTFKKEEKVEYGLICRACLKPNRLGAKHCTSCYFDCDEWDIQKIPSNIFLDIIEGRYTETPVLFRNERVLLFDDKYFVSKNHIDVIPVEVIEDIEDLDSSHLELLKEMFQEGLNEFKKRDLQQFKDFKLEDLLTCGFNFPVSVKHLHLHMILPPFNHKNCFKTSRWHPYKKVISDLETFGKVKMYKGLFLFLF
jgi:diadenosine tetraphosphate (Ap4A) HIT family hydrolase